ncbi:hypothetical protein [Nonomuraea pusilla]|uniref:Uncharacterized protein n=1 Tax=Nonomuraea pusilla TaxID=46177 RepID=A0A1H8HLL2_9ACTN|nr:hypothetical protein [Nonomuraea pusilla]SEN56954.1 hypothetical protein SAMN05660976_07851 [Nonomuraea pusilla]
MTRPGATLLQLADEQEQDLLVSDVLGETPRIELAPDTEIDGIVVACTRCMRPFDDDADNEPCIAVPMP